MVAELRRVGVPADDQARSEVPLDRPCRLARDVIAQRPRTHPLRYTGLGLAEIIGGVPLHRDFERALVALALERDHLALDRVLVLVEVGDEVDDAALVLELGSVAVAALVDDRDVHPAGQKRGVTHPLLDRLEVDLKRLEDLGVGQEGDLRAGLLRSPRRADQVAERACRARSSAGTRSRRVGPRRRAARTAR